MDFQEGTFQDFRAVAEVHLGDLKFSLPSGAVVGFDGSTMKYGGQLYPYPKLLSGIKAGFLVPTGSAVIHYIPQPAGVQVRPAVSTGSERGAPMKVGMSVEDDEVQVGSLAASQQKTKDAAARPRTLPPPPPPEPVVAASIPVPVPARPAPPVAPKPAPSAPAPVKEYAVVTEEAEDQGAVTVGRILGPATVIVDMTDTSAVRRQLAQLDPLHGAPPSKTTKIATTVPQGEDIKAVGPGGSTGDVSETRSGDGLEELLPDAVSAGVPASVGKTQSSNPPEFAWDMTRHWKTRVKDAVENFASQSTLIEQILAVEQPNVAKHIRSELTQRQQAA